jgi:hypothetical protein
VLDLSINLGSLAWLVSVQFGLSMPALNTTNISLSRESFAGKMESLAGIETSNAAQRHKKNHRLCWIFFQRCDLGVSSSLSFSALKTCQQG